MTSKHQEHVPLPDKWEAGIGERSDQHYTKWFYHTGEKWEIELYWDDPAQSGDRKHKAVIHKVRKRGEDIVTSPIESARCDSEEEAEEEAIKMMKKAKNGDYK